jgi:DNA polymerase I
MKDEDPVVLIDGSSYLFRAFHALPKLMSTKGKHTGAIKGVISMIRKLMADHPDSHIAVVFDAKGKSFRNDIYPDYKANREKMPTDLGEQIAPIHEIIRRMGVPLLIVEGVEADDVIGTLADQAVGAGMNVLISTGDKDMAQLVNERVTLINTMTELVLDPSGVVEKFGVRPDQIVDYLALVGDASDNIPGVPKCGPKTAVKWLAEYGSLDGVVAHAGEVGGKVGDALREAIATLPMSYALASIKLDVSLPVSLTDLRLSGPDNDKLKQLFTEYEFKQWADELEDNAEAQHLQAQRQYETILTESRLEAWTLRLKSANGFAFHITTTRGDYVDAEIVGFSFSVQAGEAAYVPVAHSPVVAAEQLDLTHVLAMLKPLLSDPSIAKVGQNLKYVMSVISKYNVELRGIAHDTMLESYVLNSVASRHDIDDLALKYLGLGLSRLEDIAGKGAKQLSFEDIPLEQAGPYAAEQADIALQLHGSLWPKLEAEPDLQRVFEEIEMPLVGVLSRIERNGVLIDSDLLRHQSRELDARMMTLQEEAYSLAGQEFNLGSPKQLQEIFFDKLALPVLQKTPKGQPSTAENVLQELALDYPLPRVILEYRGLSKLKSTYTDQLPKQVHARTGRIHTTYQQAVAATGRLSSQFPNLQNIPIRTDEGRRVRKAFIAPEGYRLLAADYSQIELRIMAHLSGDEGLLSAFKLGEDIHRATAAEVFGVGIEEVKDFQRRSAKAINFGLIYGMSAFGLARQLSISRNDAQAYIDLYFERYPGVRQYMDRTRALAAEQGFVETLFGRRLYLPDIRASNFQRRQAAERTAINAPMQGTAADIIKRAMISVDRWLAGEQVDARIIMQVHDELVLEVSIPLLDATASEIRRRMAAAATLAVPLVVDVGIGDDWDAAH